MGIIGLIGVIMMVAAVLMDGLKRYEPEKREEPRVLLQEYKETVDKQHNELNDRSRAESYSPNTEKKGP